MTKIHVLFLCPHGAAKSVLAMTYFRDSAEKLNLQATADNAGTEPDPTINPKVEAYLKAEGFDLPGFETKLLTEELLESADIVVSIGCIAADRLPAGTRYIDWSDVPMLSDDFEKARARIVEHVAALADALKAESA